MENTEKHILSFYVALFGSAITHSILLLILFFTFPTFEPESKTIPFQLVSNDRKGQNSNQAQMSKSENALAAQEFLRTLNESSFEQLIKNNTFKATQGKDTSSPFKQELPTNTPFIQNSISRDNFRSKSAFQGLQDIFSKRNTKERSTSNIQQISTKSLDELTQYEILLLQKLAENELYDDFHPIMASNKQTNIGYTITLHLFSNGAIRSANIKESSSIREIDQLAIKAAYSASPFPKPPSKDISKNFKYDIPIIYQKSKAQ